MLELHHVRQRIFDQKRIGDAILNQKNAEFLRLTHDLMSGSVTTLSQNSLMLRTMSTNRRVPPKVQRRGAVGGFAYYVKSACLLEDMSQAVTHQRVVIGDQYANHVFSYSTFVANGNAREPVSGPPLSALHGKMPRPVTFPPSAHIQSA
jgi:hypothetical protein